MTVTIMTNVYGIRLTLAQMRSFFISFDEKREEEGEEDDQYWYYRFCHVSQKLSNFCAQKKKDPRTVKYFNELVKTYRRFFDDKHAIELVDRMGFTKFYTWYEPGMVFFVNHHSDQFPFVMGYPISTVNLESSDNETPVLSLEELNKKMKNANSEFLVVTDDCACCS